MAVGHTKFAPDRGFGYIRSKEKVSHSFDGEELLSMISNSATSNVGALMDNTYFKEWKVGTDERYKKIKRIKKAQLFR